MELTLFGKLLLLAILCFVWKTIRHIRNTELPDIKEDIKRVCFYCKRIFSCYPEPACNDCYKECEFRGVHLFNQDIKVRIGGSCNSCYNELIRDLE